MSNRNGSNGRSNGGDKKSGFNKPGAKLGQKPRGNKSVAKTFVYEKDDAPRLHEPRKEKKAQPQNDMRLGEFTIERMGHDGRGITQWNGKTLFVNGAITGERVSARLVAEHSRYAEARIDKIIEASPERETPVCPHYVVCGGCQAQHLNSAQQLLHKESVVLEQLERWGGVKPKHKLAPITSPSIGYRRSARLGVWYEDGDVTLGFREQGSNTLVQVDNCAVLVPSLNLLLAPLKTWLLELRAAQSVTHIEVIHTEDRNAVVFRHVKSLEEVDIQNLTALSQSLGFDAWLQGGDNRQLRDLPGNIVDPRLVYRLPDFNVELGFHPNDFIQVNTTVNTEMVAQALQLLNLKGTERVLDLFCGIGNFTLPLARHSGEVIGIEAVETMVERGRENANRSNITNAQFLAANLATMSDNRFRTICGKIDAVLLDPPRDGAKEIVEKLPQLSPKHIVYVSCNPATLARDAKILASAGYQLDSLGVMDMFPHTAHIESMALFVRRK